MIVILSCQKNSHLWDNLKRKDSNAIIFCGVPNLSSNYLLKDRILYLKCEDTYDHLPTKIYMMISTILKIETFSTITHIFKLDDHDTDFDKSLYSKIKNIKSKQKNYCGQWIIYGQADRKWHYDKCPITSRWYNIPYTGDIRPWCDGGCGYLLSRHSMNLICCELDKINIYENHIYEDVMIGTILYKYNIVPMKIDNIIVGDKVFSIIGDKDNIVPMKIDNIIGDKDNIVPMKIDNIIGDKDTSHYIMVWENAINNCIENLDKLEDFIENNKNKKQQLPDGKTELGEVLNKYKHCYKNKKGTIYNSQECREKFENLVNEYPFLNVTLHTKIEQSEVIERCIIDI